MSDYNSESPFDENNLPEELSKALEKGADQVRRGDGMITNRKISKALREKALNLQVGEIRETSAKKTLTNGR